jgi:ubiquinone/menaquinone biosynthesis C-methylase UbiE
MHSCRKKASLDRFNKAASTYDSKFTKWTKRTHPFIIDELRREPVAAVLDVGCGTGTLLSTMDGSIRKAGLDISPEMLNRAREKLGLDVDLRVGDSEQLPWTDNSFDAVTISLSFHHYENTQTVLREIRRVLTGRGRVIIGDMCPRFPLHGLINLFMRLSRGGDVHLYSEKEMRALLSETGFQDISWKRTSRDSFIVSARAGKV